MKDVLQKYARPALALLLTLALVCLLSYRPAPEGAVPRRHIVSCCVGDATGDGVPELLALSGTGSIDTGERCGQALLVCDASSEEDAGRLGYIPPEKIRHRIDLAGIKPLKVQLGDINGDGLNEVSVCVYKTAKFHPEMAKRPFFFDLKEGNLIPIWLGSRLSRPFDDYILSDLDGDGYDEIIAVEQLENGGRLIAVYGWKGFGFELLAQSAAYDGLLRLAAADGQDASEICAILSNNKEQTALKFRLDNDNRLVSSSY